MQYVRNMTMWVCVSVIVGVLPVGCVYNDFFVGVLAGAHVQQKIYATKPDTPVSPVCIYGVLVCTHID